MLECYPTTGVFPTICGRPFNNVFPNTTTLIVSGEGGPVLQTVFVWKPFSLCFGQVASGRLSMPHGFAQLPRLMIAFNYGSRQASFMSYGSLAYWPIRNGKAST